MFTYTKMMAQDVFQEEVTLNGKKFKTYPSHYENNPGIQSPILSDDNREVILLKIKDQHYALLDVTRENGSPFNYNSNLRGKGNQLDVDSIDFPTLKTTGLHSYIELSQVQSITGIPVAEITYKARPDRMSGTGFIADDEDILSVLHGDNQLVSAMGLTHSELSRPVFHLWNLILFMIDYEQRGKIPSEGSDTLFYNGKRIHFAAPDCRGWQYSIFNDNIQGECHLELEISLTSFEKSFIDNHYSYLSEEEKYDLINKLTHLHTGEMVAYYIQYYGFYEGHTDFRADPIKLAFIFGFRSIAELHEIFEGRLYERLVEHHPSIYEFD
jgi:hypothetical protein